MRRTMSLIAVMMLAATLAGCGAPEDTKANRKAAAKEYLDAIPIKEMINDAAGKMAVHLPESQREKFISYITDNVNIERIEKMTSEAMVKVFTPEEINALREFQESDVGKSIISKYGDYMGALMPVMLEEVGRAAEAFSGGRGATGSASNDQAPRKPNTVQKVAPKPGPKPPPQAASQPSAPMPVGNDAAKTESSHGDGAAATDR